PLRETIDGTHAEGRSGRSGPFACRGGSQSWLTCSGISAWTASSRSLLAMTYGGVCKSGCIRVLFERPLMKLFRETADGAMDCFVATPLRSDDVGVADPARTQATVLEFR